jgi:squalene-associated FAD-dependent desaturase
LTGGRVVVVGGGLAGISAALTLTEAGLPVTVLEARPWLGGATWSFGRRGLTIDNGQHAFLRCFTAYRDLLARLGTDRLTTLQERLDLTALTGDGPTRLRRSGWPAPLHLARALAGYRPLTLSERMAVVSATTTMWFTDLSDSGQDLATIGDWLDRHGQGSRTRARFWDTFLVPILNAASEQADLGTAAGLVNASLLSRRDQADIGIPSVPLRDLHGGPAAELLARLGAEVRLGVEVTAIERVPDGGYAVRLGDSPREEDPGRSAQLMLGSEDPDTVRAAAVVLAVPAWAAAPLVPAELAAQAARWGRIEPSPIVSVHVMFDTKVTELPFAVAVDSPLRWIVDKTRPAGLHVGQYLAASIPAAAQYVDAPSAAVGERVLPEFQRLFPAAASAGVEEFFVTRERAATFRPAPGTRAIRPAQDTELAGFALAGAWTDTGWPDTMEGAVRSGGLAAESVLRSLTRTSPSARKAARARTVERGQARTGGKAASGAPAVRARKRPAAGTAGPREPAGVPAAGEQRDVRPDESRGPAVVPAQPGPEAAAAPGPSEAVAPASDAPSADAGKSAAAPGQPGPKSVAGPQPGGGPAAGQPEAAATAAAVGAGAAGEPASEGRDSGAAVTADPGPAESPGSGVPEDAGAEGAVAGTPGPEAGGGPKADAGPEGDAGPEADAGPTADAGPKAAGGEEAGDDQGRAPTPAVPGQGGPENADQPRTKRADGARPQAEPVARP